MRQDGAKTMAADEYTELPVLMAYISALSTLIWVLLGSLLTGNPAIGVVGGIAAAALAGVISYVSTYVVIHYILHEA